MPRATRKPPPDLGTPDEFRSKAWLSAHVVLTAAVAWLDAVQGGSSPEALAQVEASLAIAVRRWLALRGEPGADLPPPKRGAPLRARLSGD